MMEKRGNVVFYNHPFTEDGRKDQTIYLDSRNIEQFVYPVDNLDYSDLDYMYLSTGEMTVCSMEIGPGGMFDPPDCHPGDEVYFVLEGRITVMNPESGQCVTAGPGEAMIIPEGTLHSGYNFGKDRVKVLAVLAPKVLEEPGLETDLRGPKRTFGYNEADFSKDNETYVMTKRMGNIDSLGSWPQDGSMLRKAKVICPVTEPDKLQVIHGNTRPLLMKFAVSSDYMHVGEYLLAAGGAVTSHSEEISHRGQTFLLGLEGPMTVLLPETQEVYVMKKYEGLYIPPEVRFKLINYSSSPARAVFAAAKQL